MCVFYIHKREYLYFTYISQPPLQHLHLPKPREVEFTARMIATTFQAVHASEQSADSGLPWLPPWTLPAQAFAFASASVSTVFVCVFLMFVLPSAAKIAFKIIRKILYFLWKCYLLGYFLHRGYLFEQGTGRKGQIPKWLNLFWESFWSQSEHRDPSRKTWFLRLPTQRPKSGILAPKGP